MSDRPKQSGRSAAVSLAREVADTVEKLSFARQGGVLTDEVRTALRWPTKVTNGQFGAALRYAESKGWIRRGLCGAPMPTNPSSVPPAAIEAALDGAIAKLAFIRNKERADGLSIGPYRELVIELAELAEMLEHARVALVMIR